MSNATEETLRGANAATVPISLLTVSGEATSPAAAGYSASTAVSGFAKCRWITIIGTLTGATGGTLDVGIDHSADGGVTWYELCHFPQISAAAAAATYTWEPGSGGSFIAVGKNKTTTFTLAAGGSAGEAWFDMLRVRMVAGSGTSAGAAQDVQVIGNYVGK